MGKKNGELSHAEVWDDSALLQSWDDALEEYKLYHSIHARGERVEEAIRAFEPANDDAASNGIVLERDRDRKSVDNGSGGDLEDGELGEEAATVGAVSNEDIANAENNPQIHPDVDVVEEQEKQEIPGMPDAVIHGVQDTALKNLMMSWYWAGFHTGFLEGQQKAKSPA